MENDVVDKTPSAPVDVALEHGERVQPRENGGVEGEQLNERPHLFLLQLETEKVEVLEQWRAHQLHHDVADAPLHESHPIGFHLKMAQVVDRKAVGRPLCVRAEAAVENLEARTEVENVTEAAADLLFVQREAREAAANGHQHLLQHTRLQSGRVQRRQLGEGDQKRERRW